MTFEWDENKNLDNIQKHKVSFEIAQEAFYDKKRILIKTKNIQKRRDIYEQRKNNLHKSPK